MDQAKLQHVRNLITAIVEGSTQNDQRQAAEAALLHLMNTDTSSTFFCLTTLYTDNSNPKDLRAGAATTLGYSLTGKAENDQPFWLKLEPDLVDYIKEACLIIPFQDDPALTQVGCSINATIYAIEIGGRGWAALLTRIVQAMEFKDNNCERYHYAAITILSSICDLVNSKSLPIPDDERTKLISTIFLAIGPEENSEDVKIAGFKALSLSINFYTNLLGDENARTYLFTQIVSNMESRSNDVIRSAYEALIETVRPLYGYLDQYLSRIIQKAKILLENPTKGGNLGILATEFFHTLATEDMNHYRASQEQVEFNVGPKHYVKSQFRFFLPQIMMNLRVDDNNDGQVQNSLFSVCVQTLIVCNEALGDEAIALTQDFIGAMDHDNSPLNIVAALTAFRCLIKSISKPQSHSLLSAAYHQILNHLDNQDFRIRFAAVEMIQTIAECCPSIMMAPENANKYFNNFFTFMEQSQDYAISIGLCKTFRTLVSMTSPDNQKEVQVWLDFAERISKLTLNQAFIGARGGPLDSQVICVNLELLVYLIQKVYTGEMIMASMEKFLEAVNEAYKQPQDRKESIMEGLLVCIGIAIHKSRRDKARFPTEFYLELFKHLYHNCNAQNFVHREMIYVIGVIATHLGLKMAVFGREVFGLLSESLKSTNEQYINCAFEVFGMMSRDKCELLDNAMVEEHLMPYLMNRIADSGCSIESKMVCFITLGEVSLNHLPVMLKWIREIFEKFKQGLEAAYQMLCEKDPLAVEIAQGITYKLIESHLCIVHALYENNRMNEELNRVIEAGFRVLARFVEGSCHPNLGCTLEHVVQCLGLITDSVVLNPPVLKAIMHRDFPSIIEIARRLRQRGTKTEMQEVTLKFFENHTLSMNDGN